MQYRTTPTLDPDCRSLPFVHHRALASDVTFRDVLIAVDTFYAEVAHSAVAVGAHLVNDVSGGEFDPDMHAEVCLLYRIRIRNN